MATVDRYVLEIDTAGAQRNINNVQGAMGGLGGAAGRLRGMIGPLAAGLAAIGAVSVVGDKINEFDELAKAARAAGAASSGEAFEGFQVLRQAMNEAGIDAGTFDRAMLNTSQRLQKGMEGAKGFSDIFDKLGDSVKDANGDLAAGPELLQAMINGLNEGTISTDEFAKVVGGRAGPLIQQQFASLNTSAEDLQATLADVAANSNIVSLDAAQNAETFNDNIGRLKEGMGQLLTDAITPLLPHLVNLSENILAKMPAFIEGVQSAFQKLEPVFSLIGTILSELVVPAIQIFFDILGALAAVITPLVDAAIPALKLGFETLGAIVEGIIGFFQSALELLGSIGDKAVQLKDAVGGAFGDMKDGVVNSAKGAYDGVTGWFSEMYDEVVGNSIVPDMVNGVVGEFNFMETGLGQAMSNIYNNVTDKFNSILATTREKLGAIRGALGNVGANISGGVSNAASGVSDFFAGFFANGGFIPGGKFGVVGEKGPELVSGPAQVTPMTGMGAVTYNINAVDVNSFQSLLARDPGYLHALVQTGANRMPGGRR